MKPILFKTICMLSALLFSAGCADKVSIVWTEGETDPDIREVVHTLTVKNAPEGTDWNIWFTSNHIYIGDVFHNFSRN